MIKIYTDGSCLENPGNGGWAAIIIDDEKKTQIKGSKKNTTNNQMELLAPIEALKKIPRGSKIQIYTDSKYFINLQLLLQLNRLHYLIDLLNVLLPNSNLFQIH